MSSSFNFPRPTTKADDLEDLYKAYKVDRSVVLDLAEARGGTAKHEVLRCMRPGHAARHVEDVGSPCMVPGHASRQVEGMVSSCMRLRHAASHVEHEVPPRMRPKPCEATHGLPHGLFLIGSRITRRCNVAVTRRTVGCRAVTRRTVGRGRLKVPSSGLCGEPLTLDCLGWDSEGLYLLVGDCNLLSNARLLTPHSLLFQVMMDEVGYGERVWIGQAEDWVTDLIKRMEMALVRCLDTIGALCREQDLFLCGGLHYRSEQEDGNGISEKFEHDRSPLQRTRSFPVYGNRTRVRDDSLASIGPSHEATMIRNLMYGLKPELGSRLAGSNICSLSELVEKVVNVETVLEAERKTIPHSGGHTKFSEGERLNFNKGQRSNKGKGRGFGGQANHRGEPLALDCLGWDSEGLYLLVGDCNSLSNARLLTPLSLLFQVTSSELVEAAGG
ncbi:hypothetical protein F2Q69_00013259 [Brassica cretica]|uniref:Uncharacterized protein n=1 Tax=Brassica cretica TaxID=69181 RepID=A0A8S9R4I2_BRACR|nr:hypothetical protein F2Q69_00013259 [Brassica cretica]